MDPNQRLGISAAARALLLVMVTIGAPGAEASQVRLLNVEELTERAARIFEGHCSDVRTEWDSASGRKVVVATFEVARSVKGVAGERVTIRQLDGIGGDLDGPAFRPGERVVLFLYGESALGLTSPVGLGQGRFAIFEDKAGRPIAVNGLGNRGLLEGISEPTRQRIDGTVELPARAGAMEASKLLDLAEAIRDAAGR